MRTLRTSSIAALVDRLWPLIHIDPVAVLPPEITSEIFSYLSPAMLLEASKASRAWRERILDSRLWKQKFLAEGWGLDFNEISSFEKNYANSQSRSPLRERSKRTQGRIEQRSQKRRSHAAKEHIRNERSSSLRLPRDASRRNDTWTWNDQNSIVEAEDDTSVAESPYDEEMHDARSSSAETFASAREMPSNTQGLSSLSRSHTTPSLSQMSIRSPELQWNGTSNSDPYGRATSIPLMVHTFSGSPRLNFYHVYKQKKRLEDNWNAGRFKSFQIPHRDHPEEAHTECVYTIQYLGRHLVSGSRDRSLRIWNLDTQRLIRKLKGHSGSVLCLQFDDSPQEDVIVSGSSDTDVIVWKFSTGEIIKKIKNAHSESVLNLKFDKRYLVTCSKDKTIKIWNRHDLRPGDREYPLRGADNGGKCPEYILDLSSFGSPRDMEERLSPQERQPLDPYTTIMTLELHGAAVNAIHIYRDQLVSASGDRMLKVWDIRTGVCTGTCLGHTKGIACVQYDGKRIVSGSSDNSIRIFDPISRVEVACLSGHWRLVRTIQAAFADVPGSETELEADARNIDEKFFEAERSGVIDTSSGRTHRDFGRNDGSADPRNIIAVGAKLPPGGGGSRWGRIVSGSYDETVIVWKKAPDGRWVIGYKLAQEQALKACGGPLFAHSEIHASLSRQRNAQQLQSQFPPRPPNAPPPGPAAPGSTAQALYLQHNLNTALVNGQLPQHPSLTQQAIQNAASAIPSSMQNIAAINNHLSNNPHLNYMLYHHPNVQNAQTQAFASQNASSSHQAPPPPQPLAQSQEQQPQPQLQPQAPQQQQVPQQQQQQQPNNPLNRPAANQQINQLARERILGQNARVFKLQFDARRIICCSQDPKIVGWDFANGDEQIIECSRFFSPPP